MARSPAEEDGRDGADSTGLGLIVPPSPAGICDDGMGDSSIDAKGGRRGGGGGRLICCGGGESGNVSERRYVCRPCCFLTALNNDSALNVQREFNLR